MLWIDGATSMLVARSLDPPSGETVPVVAVPVGFAIDVDVDGATAVLSFFGDPAPPPLLVPLDGSAPVTLEGVTATQPPLAVRAGSGRTAVDADDDPHADDDPPTTAPATPAGVMLATAGDDGITVIEGGVEVRRLDQPADDRPAHPGRRGDLPTRPDDPGRRRPATR